MREIEAFLSSKPTEIVTLILEDYVKAYKGLTKVFTKAGLMKYWFPISKMPRQGQDWPSVSDMIAKNQRLLVFTSMRSKQNSEGIAYQWNYMVENQCKISFFAFHSTHFSQFWTLKYIWKKKNEFKWFLMKFIVWVWTGGDHGLVRNLARTSGSLKRG